MTDLVERLKARAFREPISGSHFSYLEADAALDREAAATISTLQAEVEGLNSENLTWRRARSDAEARAEAAEARIKELEAALPAAGLGWCDRCGGEGRIYGGHPNDPHPRDEGECKACRGAGRVEPVQGRIAPANDLNDIRF